MRTTLAEAPAAKELGPATGPAATATVRPSRVWAIGAATTAGLGCLARYGYTFGTGDHLVLMPRGVANAEPSAFQGDWFVESAPQPHWLFDYVTEAGYAAGSLPAVPPVLAPLPGRVRSRRPLAGPPVVPGRPWSALLLGPLLVLGPEKVLGSTTPLLGIALPHMLGGCLALLALAALGNRHWTSAVVVALVAGIVHVQHGVLVAPILLLTGILATAIPRRPVWSSPAAPRFL